MITPTLHTLSLALPPPHPFSDHWFEPWLEITAQSQAEKFIKTPRPTTDTIMLLLVTKWTPVARMVMLSLRAYSAGAYMQTEGRKTYKDVFSRKTFLIDYYKHLNDNNDIVLYCHHNNINKVDNAKIRTDLKSAGAQLNHISNNLYRVYLRNAAAEDPALVPPPKTELAVANTHPLHPLLKGPTAIITIPSTDPLIVKLVLKVLKAANEKLFLIGARVEALVYDVKAVDEFKELPTKEQLHGQLAGLLTVLGGAGLVRTLESAGTHLYLTLDTRKSDMEGEGKE